jgi:hypothetical protein
MVVAKHDKAHQELARQFHDREVEKEYMALVWGVVQAGRRIDEPIGRDPKDRQKMSTRARRARSAVTRVTFARHFKGATFVKVAIATGRTHQIRVHLSAIGHPIVGDQTYGGVHRRVGDNLRAVLRLERPFLHACRLSFTHPGDGRRVDFDSPLPPELEAVIDDITPEGRGLMADPDRLSTDGSSTAKSSTSTAIASACRTGREVTVDVIRHPPSAVIVPVPEPGQVILIRQYRYAVNQWPAGSAGREGVDEGRTRSRRAGVSAPDEIGQVPDTVVGSAATVPDAGLYATRSMFFFRASGLSVPENEAGGD